MVFIVDHILLNRSSLHIVVYTKKRMMQLVTEKKRKYNEALAEGVTFFVFSIFLTHYASIFAQVKASNSVEDIILSNFAVRNTELIFVHGAIAISIFFLVLCFRYFQGAPYMLKTISLFISIRALFVSMTHIGPYPTQLVLESNLLNFITSGNDLFFSGHTGMPFLIALMFWKHVYLRNIFLAASIIFGSAALLSHLHYTIDVFAAFFITYSIYTLSKSFFRRDYEEFYKSV